MSGATHRTPASFDSVDQYAARLDEWFPLLIRDGQAVAAECERGRNYYGDRGSDTAQVYQSVKIVIDGLVQHAQSDKRVVNDARSAVARLRTEPDPQATQAKLEVFATMVDKVGHVTVATKQTIDQAIDLLNGIRAAVPTHMDDLNDDTEKVTGACGALAREMRHLGESLVKPPEGLEPVL